MHNLWWPATIKEVDNEEVENDKVKQQRKRWSTKCRRRKQYPEVLQYQAQLKEAGTIQQPSNKEYYNRWNISVRQQAMLDQPGKFEASNKGY